VIEHPPIAGHFGIPPGSTRKRCACKAGIAKAVAYVMVKIMGRQCSQSLHFNHKSGHEKWRKVQGALRLIIPRVSSTRRKGRYLAPAAKTWGFVTLTIDGVYGPRPIAIDFSELRFKVTHQAKPGGKLTSVLERASVANGGDQRCRRHRADPFDLAETLADLAVAIELSDLSLVTGNPRIKFDQFFPQLSHQRVDKRIGSVVLNVPDDPRQSSPQIADVLCNDNAVLPRRLGI
jgi:hypothetical protein